MTRFRCTSVDILYTAEGTVADVDQASYGPVEPAEVEDQLRAWIIRWTELGYHVRSGDTWATGTNEAVSHAVCFDRLSVAEAEAMEAAEAAAEAQYDAHVNA